MVGSDGGLARSLFIERVELVGIMGGRHLYESLGLAMPPRAYRLCVFDKVVDFLS